MALCTVQSHEKFSPGITNDQLPGEEDYSDGFVESGTMEIKGVEGTRYNLTNPEPFADYIFEITVSNDCCNSTTDTTVLSNEAGMISLLVHSPICRPLVTLIAWAFCHA